MFRTTAILSAAASILLALPTMAQDNGTEPIVEPLNRTEAAQQLPEVGSNADTVEKAGDLVQADLAPQAVKAIEEALTDAGYSPGTVDGVWTEETAQALTIFKQTEGIESEGMDTATLEALELEDRATELGLKETAEPPEGDEATTAD